MLISLFDSPSRVDVAVDNAQRSRSMGLHRYWVNQVSAADTMVTLGVVASKVPDILFGTSVMAMQTMLPHTMAQQALTVNQISGGRFTLGLGVNHEPVVAGMWGLPWEKPYSHFVEYLNALQPLLAEQKVQTSGEWVTSNTRIQVPADPPDMMLAALGPRMLRLAAERSVGTITWMTGPNTIRDHIRPNIGDDRQIVAGIGLIVTDDVDAARERANKVLAIYPQLPSYRSVMEREGVTEAADLVLIGNAEQVTERLQLYAAAGTDEVAVSRMGDDAQNEAAWQVLEKFES
ncbi:MAG: TIGR03564 family F420-dependent LLM class oxidoreductase [Acidimicrobiales bacterium]